MPPSTMDVPVKIWHDDAWYAEAVTIPQAHVCASSRDQAVRAIQEVLRDLQAHGLLKETAELATVHA